MSRQARQFFEIHPRDCTCSYCKATPGNRATHYGLNLPRAWRSPIAWWVVKFGPRHYLRWTNPWLRRFW